MKRYIALTMAFSCLSYGCATYRPIVDMRGYNRWDYEIDYNACQKIADQVPTGSSIAAGAGVGAGIGALAGLIVGVAFNVNPAELAGFGAAMGGLQGASIGGAEAVKSKREIIKNCMIGRGYNVLN